jgi:hypothetical protein
MRQAVPKMTRVVPRMVRVVLAKGVGGVGEVVVLAAEELRRGDIWEAMFLYFGE